MKKIIIYILIFFSTSILPFSQIKYEVQAPINLIEKSRDILKQQVGVKELTNNNDGTMVVKYLRSVGRNKGDAWCNALQYYSYLEAAKYYNYSESVIPMYKSGLANDTYKYGIKFGKKVSYEPKLDDFIVWRIEGTGKGHIERTIEVKTSGWIITVGGNTSSDASGRQEEGEGCYSKKRNIYHPLSRTLHIRGLIGVIGNIEIGITSNIRNADEENFINFIEWYINIRL